MGGAAAGARGSTTYGDADFYNRLNLIIARARVAI